MEPSICSTSVTPAAVDKPRFYEPKIFPRVLDLAASGVFGPGVPALISFREEDNWAYAGDAMSRAELALRQRTSHPDASYLPLPDVHALSPPWSHLVLPPSIQGFMATIAQMTGIAGNVSFLDISDAAMCFLLRRTTMPAVGNITPTPPAIRIFEAQPDSQGAGRLWHVPDLPTSVHKTKNSHEKDSSLCGDRDKRGVAQISFWLLLNHLPTPLRRRIFCTTGTIYRAAAAPYLSAQLCDRKDCDHDNDGAYKAFQTLVGVGNTSLFNRFLLREKVMHVQDIMHMDTSNVAHYAMVVGQKTCTIWKFEPSEPFPLMTARSITKALSQPSNRAKSGQGVSIALAGGSMDSRTGHRSRSGTGKGIGKPYGKDGDAGNSRPPLSVPASPVPIVWPTCSQPVISEETQHVGARMGTRDYGVAKKNDQQAITRAYERNWGQLWKGCTIDCLFIGSTSRRDGMEDLGDFINSIHEWGMGDYARSVVCDVEDIHASRM